MIRRNRARQEDSVQNVHTEISSRLTGEKAPYVCFYLCRDTMTIEVVGNCSRSLRPCMSRRGAVGDRGVCVCLLASSDRIQNAQGVTSRRARLRLRTLTRHPRRARARQVLPPRRARGPIERASPSIRHAGVLGLGWQTTIGVGSSVEKTWRPAGR